MHARTALRVRRSRRSRGVAVQRVPLLASAARSPGRPPTGKRCSGQRARIIAVPEQPPGDPPLSAAGYRTGAVSVDRERAVDAIRKLGGDYAIADAHGRYVLQLPAGRYQILFLSRHLSRNSEQPLDLHLNSILASFFDQPQGLVGSVLVESQAIEFDGRPRVLDHAFGK
ncbi:MAG: hypothetical protein U0992_16335 [Planctomycetaceae bacterium]